MLVALISFKMSNALAFIEKDGYAARLDNMVCSDPIMLVKLDGTNEIFMDVMLHAVMDLADEGKTIADIKYKGKGTMRWFQVVFPPIVRPLFYGILGHDRAFLGYLVASQSSIALEKKALGIA